MLTSPAELGLATPLVTITAIARAAREGILVKRGLYLEALVKVDTVVFDKGSIYKERVFQPQLPKSFEPECNYG